MATPTSPPAFLRCKCVGTRLNSRALTYTMKGKKIDVDKVKTEMVSALSDGAIVYLNKKEGFTPEFEEGVSYILQNYTLSNTYGQMYLFVGPGTLKFKTVPQEISEEAQNAARAALCPPSPSVTGEEADIFSRGGYLSLQGQIKE
ncbi:hypothetical protein M9458_055004, partial [Cirrhinus mrigala]